MQLTAGKVAVVTGAASGIGLALATRFARAGLDLVLADVDEAALKEAAAGVAALGVEVAAVPTDVSDEASVQALAAAAVSRFGGVNLVCNNAGVVARSDPWFGPMSPWQWVMGVNFWGVVHGVRAFLPLLAAQSEAHIVNTASIAGLAPGFSPAYDASKHAVVAITEDLYSMMQMAGLPIGVSVLCPGWVRTGILDAERNWPDQLGQLPEPSIGSDAMTNHVRRAVDEGMPPAAVADIVASAIEDDRFWILPHPEFLEMAVRRWHTIAEGANPERFVDVPGLPPAAEIAAQIRALLGLPA